MLEEAQRLTDLVDALLTLARMDATKADAPREEVKLLRCSRRFAINSKSWLTKKRQTIAVMNDDNVAVKADRTLLHLAW